MEKNCRKCGLTKVLSLFPKSKNRPDGVGSWCKSCANLTSKSYYEGNSEEIKAKNKLWRGANKDTIKEKRKLSRAKDVRKILLYSAKYRAKEKGLDFDLELEDIVIPEFCPILGIKLELFNESQNRSSPSLDRVDSSRGYTKDNLMVISWKANTMKTDATFEELLTFASWVIENKDYLENKMKED